MNERPIPGSYHPTITACMEMLSSGHYLATLAEERLLARGRNAVDAGSVVLALLVFLLASPAGAQAPPVLADTFNASRLDLGKWDAFPYGGASASTGAGLQIALNGSTSFSTVRVFTFYQFTGDFDAQVDFNLGNGWNTPFPASDSSPQLNGGAIGVYLDEPNWMTIFRGRFGNAEGFSFYSNVTLGGSPTSRFAPSTASRGSLRLVSSAGTYHFFFNTGSGWVELASAPAWNRPVRLFLNATNVNAHVSFSTTLGNFRINSGAIDYRPYQLPDTPLRRDGFVAGGQFINEAISRYFRNLSNDMPMNQLLAQGMGLARGCMTTVSDPELASTPAALWHTLGWKESYWSSREMVAQLFKDAVAAGMRINTCFYLSNGPADAGRQNAPPDWANLSVADTASVVEQYTYDTTTYFLSQGIRADLYDIGNEILYGVLNFRPGQRIAIPPGVDFQKSISYLQASVWPIEATLLTAAIRGVRRADPDARIVLHVESAVNSPGMEAAYAFFEAMQSLRVPYDVAALSLPYVDSTDLSGFTGQAYFQRWETLVNRIATLGKPVYMAESSYPASAVAGTYPAIPDFPYTDAGQAAYLRSQMRWASNNPNIIGWAWFYPEWYSGISGNSNTPVLDVSGLFSDRQTLRPAAAALNFQLGPLPPTTRLSLNATEFRRGEAISIGIAVQNPVGNAAADLYVGVLLPDGQTAVSFAGVGVAGATASLGAPAGLSRFQVLAGGGSVEQAEVFRFTFPSGIATGTYWAFVALVRAGALSDNRVDGEDVLALDVKSFTVTP